MLWLLATHAGEVLTYDQLLRTTRNIDYDGLDRSIDIAISRLRKKLMDDTDEPTRIKNILDARMMDIESKLDAVHQAIVQNKAY